MDSLICRLSKLSLPVQYGEAEYPSLNKMKEAVAFYCGEKGLPYEFKGSSRNGNPVAVIDGKEHEILCRFFRGGYDILCREL